MSTSAVTRGKWLAEPIPIRTSSIAISSVATSSNGSGNTTRSVSNEQAVFEKTRKQDPQKTIEEFWDNFTTKQPGKVLTVLPDNLYAKRAAAQAPKGIIPGQNAVASFEDAVAICKDKVEKICTECKRVNQKYRDVHFDIETDWKSNSKFRYCLDGLTTHMDHHGFDGPGSVKRVEDLFENPKFFIDGANADVGVYGFVFHRDGEWISTIIDDKLYLIKPDYDEQSTDRRQWETMDRINAEEEYRKTLQTGSRALYFAQCSDPNETWLPLLEKAYAKAHGDFASIEGGFVGEAIEDLTGGVTRELFTAEILDKEKFWQDELMKVNQEFLFGCFTGIFGGEDSRKGIQEGHAYSIMKVVEMEGERLVLLRNPWGKTEWTGAWSDGSKEWTPRWMELLDHRFGDDGVFWISYEDLLKKFQHFDRTRLFGPEWTVTQQWTSLNVPWSVDYHDTKFTVELHKPGPVVIVLSQLDDRYFQGLEGQYTFKLQFRVHKEGEREYIVRSNGCLCMTRSVSTEIDLEPGRYSILLKITAHRDLSKSRPEDVVRRTCKVRRDKLLQIGLSYDLAHAKGQYKESEEDNVKRQQRAKKLKDERRRKAIEKMRAARREAKCKERMRRAQKKEKEMEAAERARIKEAKEALKARLARLMDMERAMFGDGKEAGRNSEEEEWHTMGKIDFVSQRGSVNADGTREDKKDDANISITDTTAGANTPDTTGFSEYGNGFSGAEPAQDAIVRTDSSSEESETEGGLSDFECVNRTLYDDPPPSAPVAAKAHEDDEFANDPWNAVCIVGLRVYSKDKNLSVEIVRPNRDEDESALDLDDGAADAAPDGGVEK
ncbi:MAG: hypothetical protein M1837_005749 [Sclerophora amabilis]|nr:MAG: hypothetical protein M1837_005749 [Sclerophora amabilis]